jgi:hypothetical protein
MAIKSISVGQEGDPSLQDADQYQVFALIVGRQCPTQLDYPLLQPRFIYQDLLDNSQRHSPSFGSSPPEWAQYSTGAGRWQMEGVAFDRGLDPCYSREQRMGGMGGSGNGLVVDVVSGFES